MLDRSKTAGVDEAGRGPLAGPVVAAAVILDPENIPEGIRDSKKLSAKRRTVLARQIYSSAKSVGVGVVHEQDIDRLNILQATFQAMRQAVAMLDPAPERVEVDGNFTIPELLINQIAIVGGDDLVPAISAASIIAKTFRDNMLISYDVLFPEYGFKSHKGYGSGKHMEVLRERGRCPIHRRSFRPVSQAPNEYYRYFANEPAYGRMGELIAGMYLIRNGYQLKVHSYHAGRHGEIDLIVTQQDEIIFVEVKSFAGQTDDAAALERVDPGKQKQIARVAEYYLDHHTTAEAECRFDIVTVNFSTPTPVINHYPDAYLPL